MAAKYVVKYRSKHKLLYAVCKVINECEYKAGIMEEVDRLYLRLHFADYK